MVNGGQLGEGDGATITETDSIRFEAVESAEAVLFDLALAGWCYPFTGAGGGD